MLYDFFQPKCLSLTIYKPFRFHGSFHTKFGPDRFSRFDVTLRFKQTNKQISKVYIYISEILLVPEEISNLGKPVFDLSLLYPRKNGLRRKSNVCLLDTQIK